MKPAFSLFVTLIVAGCRAPVRDVVRSEVTIQMGTNIVRIEQPKDTTVERLQWNGLVLEGYTSTANAAAISAAKAQAEAQAAALAGMARTFGDAVRVMGAVYGVRLPDGTTSSQVPVGFKLVPKDENKPVTELKPSE